MSITEYLKKINTFQVIFIILIILSLFLSFGLGRISGLQSSESKIEVNTEKITDNCPAVVNSPETALANGAGEGQIPDEEPKRQELYVGSKNSDKYHYPWCSGAQRIKDDNKVWFSSVEEAKAAGYVPAGNCPGL